MRARVIAYYLPQFHSTPNNDKWWGKGFTEWTNVGKAKKLYYGHEQPKVPADLGYYDLRLPQVRKQQAEMAKEAGIEAFCYYHYWFNCGNEELYLPFNEVMRLGEPGFPFCLCWANESWHSKFWNKDGTYSSNCLVEQRYEGEEENGKHFYALLPAFKDKRYVRVDDKPLFVIYRPLHFENLAGLIEQWNKLAQVNGLKGLHFVGRCTNPVEITDVFKLGVDSISIDRLQISVKDLNPFYYAFCLFRHFAFNYPFLYAYSKIMKHLVGKEASQVNVYPTIYPNWDHSPRSGNNALVLHGSTPALFGKLVDNTLKMIKDKPIENNIVFLKSWNEWGEGNYMEPDLKFGKEYINILNECLSKS